MIKYKLIIWFRFYAWGEQHKDFEEYEIEALGVHDAFNRIEKKYFSSRAKIPISYTYMGATYKPFQYRVDRRDENFNKPLSSLNKEY